MQPSAFFSNASFYLGPQGEPPLSRTGFLLLSLIMAIFTGPAIVLNATVIIVSLMHRQLRQPLNYALVNMAVADLGTAMTGGVLSVVNNAQGYFSLGRTGCVMEGFAVSLFGECWLCAVGDRITAYVKCLCPKTLSPCALIIMQSVLSDQQQEPSSLLLCTLLTVFPLPLVFRHHISVHGCSDRRGEDVCHL